MLAFSTSRGEILVDSAIVYTEEQASTKTMETRKVRLNSEAMAALLAQKDDYIHARWQGFQRSVYDEPWLYHWLYQRITDSVFWTSTIKRLGI